MRQDQPLIQVLSREFLTADPWHRDFQDWVLRFLRSSSSPAWGELRWRVSYIELRGISGRVWKLRLVPESAKTESARVHPDTRPTANLAGRIKVQTQRKVLRLECEWLIISTSSGSTVTARDVWRWRRWEFWRAFCLVNFYWPWDTADGCIVRVCVGARRPPQCVNTCICMPLWFSLILVNGKKKTVKMN